MAVASVKIPAGLVGAVRESLVLLYHGTVEGLHFALRSLPAEGEPRNEILRSRARLARLDALLLQLGWWSDVPEDHGHATEVELTGPREVLQDAFHGALIDAGERLATACGDSWRGDAAPEEVQAAAMEVIALDRLLAQVRE
jgi:hypothetical protein